MTTKELAEQLEALVDAFSLSEVINTLSDISNGKADHLRSNWQDEKSAVAWTRSAGVLDRTRHTIEKAGL